MAKTTKNLSKPIEPDSRRSASPLHLMIAQIRERQPEYYAGRGGTSDILIPANLLLFSRLKRSILVHGSPSSHHRFVLIVNEGGEGSVVLDDMLVPLSPGQAVLIFPYQHHHYANLLSARLSWLFITFELPHSETLEPLRYQPVPISELAWGNVQRMCEHWLRDPIPSATDHPLLLEAAMLLQELLVAAEKDSVRSVSRSVGGVDRELLQKIGEYLNSHLDQPVAVGELAEYVSLSESHLRSRFRRHFGMSLGRYIRRTKATRAAQLLDVTEMSVSEVARACGFDSIYAFSRFFRSNTGLSPRQYRQRKKDKGM